MKRKAVIIAVFPLLFSPGFLLSEGVGAEITAGFSGYYVSGCWTHINISLESQSPPFDAAVELEIPLGSFNIKNRGSYSVIREVRLSPGEPLRLSFSVPVEHSDNITLRILKNGEVLQEKMFELNPRSRELRTALVLNRGGAALPGAWGGLLTLQAHPGTLPVAPQCYGALSAVIIGDAPLEDMSQPQGRALADWIRGGGLLIVRADLADYDSFPRHLSDLLPRGYGEKGEYEKRVGLGRIASTNADSLKLQDAGAESCSRYPVKDPFPDLIEKTAGFFPSGLPPLALSVLPFMLPLAMSLSAAFAAAKRRRVLIILIAVPACISAAVLLFYPDERPVYTELSCMRADAVSDTGMLFLKGGITSREEGTILIDLNLNDLALPDRNGSASIIAAASGSRLAVERRGWGTAEFFISSIEELPIGTEIRREGEDVSGFIDYRGEDWKAIFINGGTDSRSCIFLPESGGLSFRISPGYNAEGRVSLSAPEKYFADYLVTEGFTGENTEADFHILLIRSGDLTRFSPDSYLCRGIQALLLDFAPGSLTEDGREGG